MITASRAAISATQIHAAIGQTPCRVGVGRLGAKRGTLRAYGTQQRLSLVGGQSRWKRERLHFRQRPRIGATLPHTAPDRLHARMVHPCAARGVGGKLGATLHCGLLIHTTRCSGGTNCHARGAGGRGKVSNISKLLMIRLGGAGAAGHGDGG